MLKRGKRETGEMNLASASRIINLIRLHLRFPGSQGAQGMGGEIGPASIEGKFSPTPAKSWPAAIAILQVEQPKNTILDRRTIFKGQIRQANKLSDLVEVGAAIL